MTLTGARPSPADLHRALAWLLASSVAATLAHGFIGLADAGEAGADTYALRAHAAVGPVAVAALILLCTALLAAALHPRARSREVDPVSAFARRLGSMNPVPPCAAVALGALMLLLGMELCEQIAATGHIEGVADALGGNVGAGLSVVGTVAILVTLGGLRSARALVAAAVAAADAFLAWVFVSTAPRATVPAASGRRLRNRRHASTAAFLAHGSGLRAPPRQPV
jgi:hypothetical protein